MHDAPGIHDTSQERAVMSITEYERATQGAVVAAIGVLLTLTR